MIQNKEIWIVQKEKSWMIQNKEIWMVQKEESRLDQEERGKQICKSTPPFQTDVRYVTQLDLHIYTCMNLNSFFQQQNKQEHQTEPEGGRGGC